MKSIGNKTLLGLALLAMCAVVTVAQVKTPRERLAERSFPNVTLTTHEGRKVKFYDDLIKDKIVIINFMYVKCDGKCPVTTANLVEVQKLLGDRIGKDIFIYSITLKPEEDTPRVLKQYAKAYKVGKGWAVSNRRSTRHRAVAPEARLHRSRSGARRKQGEPHRHVEVG